MNCQLLNIIFAYMPGFFLLMILHNKTYINISLCFRKFSQAFFTGNTKIQVTKMCLDPDK